MAFKSIYKDEEAKKGWKTTFEIVYFIWLLVWILRMLLVLRDRVNSSVSLNRELFTEIGFVLLLLYLTLYIAYWIKPSWFRISKEQKVEGCDAPGVD